MSQNHPTPTAMVWNHSKAVSKNALLQRLCAPVVEQAGRIYVDGLFTNYQPIGFTKAFNQDRALKVRLPEDPRTDR